MDDEVSSPVLQGMGQRLRGLRVSAGLSQTELAKRIGTTQSAVARLESAAYDRHSLYTLKKIAAALSQKIRIDFEPETARLKKGASRG